MSANRTVQARGNNAPVLESQLDHNTLLNLTVGDVHTHYSLVDGTRAFTGTVTIGSGGGLVVNTDTLVVDATGSMVGIGITDPVTLLHLFGAAATLRIEDDGGGGTNYFEIDDTDSSRAGISKTTATGPILLDLDPLPQDGTGAATVRLFRSTNTSGDASLQLFRGNAGSTIDIQLGVNGLDSFFNSPGAMVGIGNNSPDRLLHLFGAAATIRIEDDGGGGIHYLEINDVGRSQAQINKIQAAGSTFLDLNPQPQDGTSEATIRMFRDTNTSGSARLDLLRGDGTGTLDIRLGINGLDSFFNSPGASVGIGNAAPGETLDVTGTGLFTSDLRVEGLLHGSTVINGELVVKGSTHANLGIIRLQSPVLIDSMLGAPVAIVIEYSPNRTFSSGSLVDGLITAAPIYTVSVANTIYTAFIEQGSFITTVTPSSFSDKVIAFAATSRVESDNATIRALTPVGIRSNPTVVNTGLGSGWVGANKIVGHLFSPNLEANNTDDKTPVGEITGLEVEPTWNVIQASSNADFGTVRGLHLKNPTVVLGGSSTGTLHIDNYYGLHMEDITSVAVQGAGRQIAVLSDLTTHSANLFLKNEGGARSELEGVMAFVAGTTAGRIRIEQDAVGVSFGASDDVEVKWNGSSNRFEFDPVAGTTLEFTFSTAVTTMRSPSPSPFRLRYSHIGLGGPTVADTDPAALTIAKFAENMPAGGVWSDARFLDDMDIDLNGVTATLLDTFLMVPSSITVNGGSVADHSVLRVDGMGTTATRNQGIWLDGARLRVDGIFNMEYATPAEITSDQNNYVIPVDGSGRSVLRLSVDQSRTITGIVHEQDGDTLWIINVTTTGGAVLTLANESGSSTAVNRIITGLGADLSLSPGGEAALLWFDNVDDRWRVLFHTGS